MNKKEYTIRLNDAELKLLLTTLGKRPFEEVYELIEKIVLSTSSEKLPHVKKSKK
jgi:hypothetical protein